MKKKATSSCLLALLLATTATGFSLGGKTIQTSAHEGPWPLHVVDNSSSGADGVRLADIDGNHLPDLVTGWEEGGITRVYLNPGRDRVHSAWPSVTVGVTPSVEDAVFFDLDGDGSLEVITSCEGTVRTMFVHWPPAGRNSLLVGEEWKTEAIPATRERGQWMFAVPAQIDGRNGVDLVVGSKGEDGMIGWLEAPSNPRRLEEWTLHPIYAAGWIMSLISTDLDRDGDPDILASDRKGSNAGVLWLENPGFETPDSGWKEHRIGADGREVMFLDFSDTNDDGREDVVVAVKPFTIARFLQPEDPSQAWESEEIAVTFPQGTGKAKAVSVGDLDLDGRLDLVFSCEGAVPPKHGLIWLAPPSLPDSSEWVAHDISGELGIKYDRIELVDLDGDGDLDILTCEENEGEQSQGLGVIWYENPHVSAATE